MVMKAVWSVAVAAAMMFVGVCSQAAEAVKPVEPKAVTAAAVQAVAPRRATLTPEQRAELREKRMKAMAERKAAMDAKQLEIIKKYVSDEAKAKALLEELKAARMPVRRPAIAPAVKK